MLTNLSPKIPKYFCNFCEYRTNNKKDYVKHNLTLKHSLLTNVNIQLTQKSPNDYPCKTCRKIYASRVGLWKHSQKCGEVNKESDKYNTDNLVNDRELIVMLVKQNSELLEVLKNGSNNTTNNVTNNTNSNNKTFNLNVFLNETCKDAMNIMDFVDSIQLQLSDLENVGKLGYVEGITNIITKNLQALDITQRPIHCTDKKREVLYIKDENKWEKEDEDKKKIRKAIKRVAFKNHRLILKYKEVHPDCLKYSSNYSDQYNKIIIESCGGSGDNETEKEDKIIRNISKTVILDK